MKDETAWEESSKWYDAIVGVEGHHYHRMVLPYVLKHMDLKKESRLLDLGCGQGVLERAIAQSVYYQGLDLSKGLIEKAKQRAASDAHHFTVADITKPFPLKERDFTHATLLFVIQNVQDSAFVFKELAKHLVTGGMCIIVMNHPCFRIPRQSHWGVDEAKKLQYRKIERYMTPLQIPIQTHPGKEGSDTTLSYHFPLSAISAFLFDAGFAILLLEEWVSDKKSSGPLARMENRAREEFPLFLMIKAVKR